MAAVSGIECLGLHGEQVRHGERREAGLGFERNRQACVVLLPAAILFVSKMGNSVSRPGAQERQQAAKMYGAEGAAAEGAARTFEPDEDLADAEAAAGAEGRSRFVVTEAAPS